MEQTTNDAGDVIELSELIGVPYQVRLSPELSQLLKPNKFLAELGIQYLERVKSILNKLKENLNPGQEGMEKVTSKKAVIFPLALVQGPFIREELITIRAELTDDGGILLTAILEQE